MIPLLNVSMPKGCSYNSNIDEQLLEKIKMACSTVWPCIVEVRKECDNVKFDLVAAYKQVPCEIENISMQGFIWREEFFAETRPMFNASNSVCNYDIIIETLKVMALSESDIPSEIVLRQEDDAPVVSPEGTSCMDSSQR